MSSTPRTVVLLHGLGRTRLSMSYAASYLSRRGFRVLNLGYPSRRRDLNSLAEHVGTKIDRKLGEKNQELNFLTHSMGGIVLRAAVARGAVATPNRVVMLSPPNQGSRMATTLQEYAVFRTILGPSAQQLGGRAGGGPTTLGPAEFSLGVITGGRGVNPVLASLTNEAHDGLVSVDEAQLEGMADFLVVPYGHTFIMNRRMALEEAAWFFEHGEFRGGWGAGGQAGRAGKDESTDVDVSSQRNPGHASESVDDHKRIAAVPASPAQGHSYTNTWFTTFLDTIDETQTAREIEFLQRHVPLSTHPAVVDLCCGSGRHARHLADRGYRVIGIDNNRGALDRARELRDDVEYRELDMRQLRSLTLEVDAVLLLWQSFGQFGDATNEDILTQIHQSLRPGGRFVLDIYNRDFFEDRCGTHQSGRGGSAVTETKEMRGNRLSVRLDYEDSDQGDRFDWRVYTTEELHATATAQGFRPVVSCAKWDESISPSSDIPRTQFVFERR